MKTAKRISLVILITLFLLTALTVTSYLLGYDVERDIRYAGGVDNLMDVYIPFGAEDREAVGCVVLIHGGSWSGGDKSEEEARARLLASRGYMAVSINYTLYRAGEDYTVCSALDDIEAAIAKAKEIADERGIRISKLATSGYSAGAHLALLYAYSRKESCPVEIAFTSSMAGPTEISREIWGEELASRIGSILTGKEFNRELLTSPAGEALLRSVSPTSYVTESSPPTLILQGGKDPIVPPPNADALATALESSSVAYDYIHLDRSDHSLSQDVFGHLGYYIKLLDYCNRYFS